MVTRVVPLSLAFGLALVLAGCGQPGGAPAKTAQHTPTSATRSTSPAHTATPIHARSINALAGKLLLVHYVGRHVAVALITDEHGFVRLDYVIDPGPSAERMTFVWDGTKVLVHNEDSNPAYILYEAPDEHRDEVDIVDGFSYDPTDASFATICPGAERAGTRSIVGRLANGYRCGAKAGKSLVIWLDHATGVLLDTDQLRADRVTTTKVRKNDGTFSTKPPRGAHAQVVAAHGGSGRHAPTFTLPGARGGTIRLSDYAGHPVVLAIFMSDVYFNSESSCSECKSLAALNELTKGGKSPKALGILVGELGKPGLPLVPGYVTFPVASDRDLAVQHSFGLSDLLGFVFIRSDGTVQASYDRALSSAELKKALAALAAG